MTEENLNSGKKRWKHLELEFIHQEQTPKEGINHLDELRIRFIVCLSFIKLNWWQAMDFAYYLFFLKRIEKWHSATFRKVFNEPPLRLKRMNELNHEEPPWRTPVTKRLWDRVKEERIRWALRWFRWRFRRNGQGNLNSGKEKRKHLKLEFISQEQTLKEGINHFEEIRIRFIVCLSFIKLNSCQAMDFAYYLFVLKRIENWHSATFRKVFNEPPLGFERTNGLKW